MKLSKTDAAGRQLNAAIKLFFQEGDPVAIHTIIAAPFTIVRNLCEQRGDVASFQEFSRWIRPGAEAKFWSAVNAQANFLKHADRDPAAEYEFNEDATELLILMTSKWFIDLGNPTSGEIRLFGIWFSLVYPDMLTADTMKAFEAAGAADFYQKLVASFGKVDQRDRRKAFNEFLKQLP
ncbi:hypothetical protein [Bradyrhizobium guangdongense]